MIDLLKSNGKFYKANLHCHTTLSDGKMTPEQVKEQYVKQGYSIVAFTDHNMYEYHEHLKDDNFLPIGGVEIDFQIFDQNGKRENLRTCHLNFYPKDPKNISAFETHPAYNILLINKYIENMTKNGWLCTLNHPAWSLQPTNEVVEIDNITAMEVYNHLSQIIGNNGISHDHYFSYLANGKKTYAVATDDTHSGLDENGKFGADKDVGGGYIQISMPSLTYENFIDAFSNGRFYASTGIDIKELYIDEKTDELVISCSPVARIITKGSTTTTSPYVLSEKNDITYARIPMKEIRAVHKTYFRLEFSTLDGKMAYSQPYYFE